MEEPKKIAVIGAGGIACMLLPTINLDYEIVLVDGDDFEPHNSKRQFPALQSTGNKAEVLAEMQKGRSQHPIHTIPAYFKGPSIVNRAEWRGVDMVIAAVDNNESRKLIIEFCDEEDIPAILCGNESDVGEAHLFLPGEYDPSEHHDFGPMTPAPFSCTSDENAESAPQTSGANFLAAAGAVHILMSWRGTDNPDNLIVHSMLDRRAQSQRTRLRDVRAQKSE